MLTLIRSLCFATATASFLTTLATAQTWRDVSPPGGAFDRVRSVGLDPADADHLVAHTDAGLFESTDAGATWTPLDTSGLPGEPAAIALTIEGDLFVGVTRSLAAAPPGGLPLLFKRSGSSWAVAGPNVTPSPMAFAPFWRAGSVAVGRGNPDLIALVVHENGNFEYGPELQHFVSDDGGATWSGPTNGNGDPQDLEILERAQGPAVLYTDAFYPSTGTISSLYRSLTWGPPSEYLEYIEGEYALATSRTEPGRAYRAIAEYFDPMPLDLSDDLGSTWVPFGAPDLYGSPCVGAVANDLLLRSIVGVTSGPGPIEVSWDGGVSWQALPYPPLGGIAAGGDWRLNLAHDDTRVYAWNGTSQIFVHDLVAATGVAECAAQTNATGRSASIRTFGSSSIAADDLRIHIDSVPPGTATLLLAAQDAGFVVAPGGSFGDLCLGGSIGRFGLTAALPTAEAFFDVSTTALPTPTGSVAAQPGETWRFQTWFRDNQAGQPGSNFSDAVALTFAL